MFLKRNSSSHESLLHDIIEDDVARNMIIQLDGNEQASMFSLMGVERIGLLGETDAEKDADLKERLLRAKYKLATNKLTPLIESLYKQMMPTKDDFITDMLLTTGKSDTPEGLLSITKQAAIYCIALAEQNNQDATIKQNDFQNYLNSAYHLGSEQAKKMSDIMEKITEITHTAFSLETPSRASSPK